MIKTFDDFDYYEEIDVNEYSMILFNSLTDDEDNPYIEENWVPFTESEISEISSLGRVRIINDYTEAIKKSAIEVSLKRPPKFWVIKHLDGVVQVMKLKDEWFVVYSRVDRKYYKCDQFYSLIKCLSEI